MIKVEVYIIILASRCLLSSQYLVIVGLIFDDH